jgi:hypothetical protein
MAACWEGLARSYSSSEQLKDFVATYCGTSPLPSGTTQYYPAATPENTNSMKCDERAAEADDAAGRTDDAFLQHDFHRLADAWRRLAAAYKLAEDVDRQSAE